MKKYCLFLIGCLIGTISYSQSVSPEVTASAGEHFSNNDIQLSWTIGELMITTFESPTNQLTQGFHQPNLVVTALEDLSERIDLKVFPNPTLDIINIKGSALPEGLNLLLYDIQGKLVLPRTSLSSTAPTTMNLSDLAAGSYFLHVRDQNLKSIKTFKIVKSH